MKSEALNSKRSLRKVKLTLSTKSWLGCVNYMKSNSFRRLDVVAPVAGTVQSLKVFTIGQVIRQGEPLLDIVPGNERLIIEVQFSPSDIDGVNTGQTAEVRFPAFHSPMIPLILGRLESVSRDRLVDESSKQPYYRGIVVLDDAQIPAELRPRVRAE